VLRQAGFARPQFRISCPARPVPLFRGPARALATRLHTTPMEHRCCPSDTGGTSLLSAGGGGAAQGRRGEAGGAERADGVAGYAGVRNPVVPRIDLDRKDL
jgi:hypothetical protein